jgi:CAP-Gly domain-containing linker protein 1
MSTSSARPSLSARRSLVSMRQSYGAGAPSTPRKGAITPVTGVPALPTPTIASRYTTSSNASAIKKAKQLEIGDEVMMDGTSLVGVLRHLGPVTFKPGEYAGLELIGNSAGMGKNDGSVQG